MNNHFILIILLFLVAVLLGGVLGRCTAPDYDVRYPDVVVPETVLVSGEPDTMASLRERVSSPVVQPEQTAVAPRAAQPDVASFCSAAGWTVTRDTVLIPENSGGIANAPEGAGSPVMPLTQPTMLLIRSGVKKGDYLTLIGPRSDGDLFRGDYKVGGGDFQFRVAGGEAFVQRDRWHGVKTWAERIGIALVAGTTGYVVGQ